MKPSKQQAIASYVGGKALNIASQIKRLAGEAESAGLVDTARALAALREEARRLGAELESDARRGHVVVGRGA